MAWNRPKPYDWENNDKKLKQMQLWPLSIVIFGDNDETYCLPLSKY